MSETKVNYRSIVSGDCAARNHQTKAAGIVDRLKLSPNLPGNVESVNKRN